MKPVEEQLDEIRRGTAEIISEEELRRKLERDRPLRVKLGIDPSAPDITLGHAVPLEKLRQFQTLGHHAILIIGDYTAMIGDPTGRTVTRSHLAHEQVMENARTYQELVFKILDKARTEIVYNGTWFSTLSFEKVIRLCASYTVARMLEREDFKKRFHDGRPISIHEFLYPLMQGYDSVMVQADVELGATEQKFNILMGRQLQREAGQEEQIAILLPVLVGLDGVQKMSKSLGNHIALDDPPVEMYGKIMSTADTQTTQYVELFSKKGKAFFEGLHPMEAKKRIAFEITERFHSTVAAEAAQVAFERQFQRREMPEEMPVFVWNRGGRTVWICRLLVETGLTKSNGEARRLIRQGGVYLDGQRIDDIELEIPARGERVLQVGRRRLLRIMFSESKKDHHLL